MSRISGFVLVALLCVCLVSSKSIAVQSLQGDVVQPIEIDNLEPKLDGTEATVKFKVSKLGGVSQLFKAGQSSTFVIETKSGKTANQLTVWIGGDLVNVLDRLEMSFLQENELKAGVTIVAKGIVDVSSKVPGVYSLHVTKWQNFRILPTKKRKCQQTRF